jgi:hypothetical protein
VVPAETSPALFHPTAVGAQAIAARTYAYWHIKTDDVTPGSINNSSAYQVFVPYRYDTFAQGERASVDAALQGRYYLSNISDYTVNLYGHTVNLTAEDPIFAEFFADRPLETLNNPPHPNLVGVADPISSHPDVPYDGHGHGLSQNGAGRWARGSSSYRCDPYPAPCPVPPSVPHFAWSVSWPERYQILTHYYTGIHVRDAGNANAIVTPGRRFVVLSANGGPRNGRICRNRDNWLTLRLQNTGVAAWDAYTIALYACWGSQCSWAAWLPQAVAPGATYPPPGAPEWTVEIAPGAGALTLDLYGPGGWFSAQYPAWPRPTLALPVVSCHSLPYIAE